MEKTLKILIIDDLKSARRILLKLLEDTTKFTASEANDGQEALELINSNNFDIILSDCHMPKMNGLELLAQVRSQDTTKALPFILVTGSAEKATIEKALTLGVSDIMIKPFTSATLKAKISEVIEKISPTPTLTVTD
jgi:two-component system chemotaxis response regulator CheY